MEKFEKISPRSKYISLASVLTIIAAIFGFGYGWTETHGGFYTVDDQYDPTVSFAVGNGLKPVIVTLISIGGLLAIYTLYLRKGRFAVFRYLLVAVILVLLIAITYVNPTIKGEVSPENESTAHYILAVTAFTITLIFNLLTYYLLYKNYLSNKWFYLILGLINFGIYFGMYVVVYVVRNQTHFFNPTETNKDKEYKNLGASAEIVQILFFLLTILLIGYYKNELGVVENYKLI